MADLLPSSSTVATLPLADLAHAACMREIVERGLREVRARHVAERIGVGARELSRLCPWADLRARAYEQVENEMMDEVFPPGEKPELVMETWLASAFDARTARAWQRWSDAWDMSCIDAAMAAAFARIQNRYFEEMSSTLAAGPWRLPDPEASAIRLFAVEDGLACQILTCAPFITRKRAESLLRGAFELECSQRGAI